MRRIEDGVPVPRVYLIALPSGPDNQLEILSPAVYRKQAERNKETLIVGLAGGMSEARQVVCQIAGDVYRLTGTADIRSFFAGTTFVK